MPGASELRDAYLGVLKLAVWDLAATTTVSVEREPDGRVASRVLISPALGGEKERDVELGAPPEPATAARPVKRPGRAPHVPSHAELDLQREVEALRARLAAAEAELDGRAARLARRLRRLTDRGS